MTLFIYNTFIKILYVFRALSCSSSGGLRRNCIYAASGIVTVCRWLFIYNTFIKILYVFRALSCSSSGGLRRNCIYAASGIVTVCRWLSLYITHLLKSSTCFKHCPARLQEVYVVIVYMQPLVSSLSADDCLCIIPDGSIVFIQFYFDLFVLVYRSYLFSVFISKELIISSV